MTGKTEFRTTMPWYGMKAGLPTIERRRIEEYENIIVASKGTPWEYEPRGPFQFQMFHQSGDPMNALWRVCPTLAEAVNEFARWGLPPRMGYAAEIVDESFRQILCGWFSTASIDGYAMTPWDVGGAWYGCRAAFDEARRQQICDDVSLAMWEVTAMRTAPGSGMKE